MKNTTENDKIKVEHVGRDYVEVPHTILVIQKPQMRFYALGEWKLLPLLVLFYYLSCRKSGS